VGLFSRSKKESQIGVEFQHDGVAVAQVRTGQNSPGDIIRSEFVAAAGQEAQVEALKKWVHDHMLQKTPCICLVADDDCDIYQVERPEVDDSEMVQAVTWKIKDLINYDVTNAVVDSYPMPVSSKHKQQQVGVVAARETVISNYVGSIKTTALELNALPVVNSMNDKLKQYAQRFNAQSIRERGLIAISLLVVISYLWWINIATPWMQDIEALQATNQRIVRDVENNRAIIRDTRQAMAAGVYQEKENQLTRLSKDLAALEDQLRVTTIELIDPEKMFQLMNQLIYRDSRLKLLSLKRREVKPAIPPINEEEVEEPGIYRHVLEIEFAGKYLDILKYMQKLELLDWKLLWDEIEIASDEYPNVTVKVVISTLSTRKEWVGI